MITPTRHGVRVGMHIPAGAGNNALCVCPLLLGLVGLHLEVDQSSGDLQALLLRPAQQDMCTGEVTQIRKKGATSKLSVLSVRVIASDLWGGEFWQQQDMCTGGVTRNRKKGQCKNKQETGDCSRDLQPLLLRPFGGQGWGSVGSKHDMCTGEVKIDEMQRAV